MRSGWKPQNKPSLPASSQTNKSEKATDVATSEAEQSIPEARETSLQAANSLRQGVGSGVHATHAGHRTQANSALLAPFTLGETAIRGEYTPPPRETLETVHPAWNAIIGPECGIAFYKRNWNQLSQPEQQNLRTLGFTRQSWQSYKSGDLQTLPVWAEKSFGDLSGTQKEAATELGFGQKDWDSTHATLKDIAANDDIREAFLKLAGKEGQITSKEVKETLIPEGRDWFVETPSEKRAFIHLLDFHGDRFTPEARRTLREDALSYNFRDQLVGGFKKLEATDDKTLVNDASGMEVTMVRELVKPTSDEDVRAAILKAKDMGAKVSIAGRRHTEGGHSVSPGSVNIDMKSMNKVMGFDRATGRVRVQAGASWSQIQDFLAKEGRAVKVMQSSNIFTVGGSLSANCHGRTPGLPPIIDTVKSMRIMTGDGEIKECSATKNSELFKHAIGGYGLCGVILDVELDTVENARVTTDLKEINPEDYPTELKKAMEDSDVMLAYGRLDPNFEDKGLLHIVKKDGDKVIKSDQELNGVGFESGGAQAHLTKAVFHSSKMGRGALKARWAAEKKVKMSKPWSGSLNQLMSPNVEFLNQYWFNEGKTTDILHEYFVPPKNYDKFIKGLESLENKYDNHSLNITLRDVGKDTQSALPYAKEDVISVVLYFNQDVEDVDNDKQQAFTQELIDLAHDCGGTFYLPYQRHYTFKQLRTSYPEVDKFFEFKEKVDPNNLFSNRWYETYGPSREN